MPPDREQTPVPEPAELERAVDTLVRLVRSEVLPRPEQQAVILAAGVTKRTARTMRQHLEAIRDGRILTS